jgi:flavin-dependent dehydrogenase
MGLGSAMEEAGFLTKLGASTIWGESHQMWTFYFNEAEPEQGGYAYQVWRPQFDEMLLNHSRAQGVCVLQPYRATRVLFKGDQAVGVEYEGPDQSRQSAYCRYVIDASGQDALLSHTLGFREWDPFFQNMAVFAYFEDAQRLPGIDRNNILIESYENGWSWFIPLHTGWTSVGTVVDRRQFGKRRQRELSQFYFEQVAQTVQVSRLLREARCVTKPTAERDWSYLNKRMWGPGYLCIGDAACFIDPLFSTGVYLAMQSGLLAAAAIDAVEKGITTTQGAFGYFQREYEEDYESLRDVARFFYSGNKTSPDAIFWKARTVLNAPEEISPREAFVRLVAGRRRIGYERALLNHVSLSKELTSQLQQIDQQHASSLEKFIPALHDLEMAPRLKAGISIEHEPTLVGTELVVQPVFYRPGCTIGYPAGGYADQLVPHLDGSLSLREMVRRMKSTLSGNATKDAGMSDVLVQVLRMVGVLTIDGYVEMLPKPLA